MERFCDKIPQIENASNILISMKLSFENDNKNKFDMALPLCELKLNLSNKSHDDPPTICMRPI